MAEQDAAFHGDDPAAAETSMLADRRELALVALERTRMPMVISNPRHPDNPIVLANQAFLDLTGYAAHEVVGRNCRFLQGRDTSSEAIERLKEALRAEGEIEVELLNYRKDGSTFWNQLLVSAVHDSDGQLLYYFASQKDVSARRTASQLETVERYLLKEIDHRAMNALALVQSIVKLSRADTAQQFARSISGRVDAIARAHRLLAASSWVEVDFEALIGLEAAETGFLLSGGRVQVAAPLVQPLSLVFHELVTNAREHGALREGPGRVAIRWEADDSKLAFAWSETGVPIGRAAPPKPSLGLSLVRNTIERQLGGTFDVSWRPDGMEAAVSVPLVR